MRIFIYVVLAAVIMCGLFFHCHQRDLKHMQNDFQAYQQGDLLDELEKR